MKGKIARRALAVLAMSAMLAACGRQTSGLPSDLAGRWKVQQIAGASLGEGVDIWIEIDASTGAIHGYSGCNAFSTSAVGFGDGLTIGPITEFQSTCDNQAAATDEARLLGVLRSVQRRIRHGRSLELLPATVGSEALLLLRLEEDAGE